MSRRDDARYWDEDALTEKGATGHDPDTAHDLRREQETIASQEEPPDYAERIRAEAVMVSDARNVLQIAGAEMARRRVDFEMANKDLSDSILKHGVFVSNLEDTLRALTLEAYEATGSKAPGPGVGIRVVEKLEYDRGEALDWAKAHGGLALRLDETAFAKIVKAMPSAVPFVTTYLEHTATISTDLDKALGEP